MQGRGPVIIKWYDMYHTIQEYDTVTLKRCAVALITRWACAQMRIDIKGRDMYKIVSARCDGVSGTSQAVQTIWVDKACTTHNSVSAQAPLSSNSKQTKNSSGLPH